MQILLAAFFLFQGATKLLGAEDAVRLSDDIGLGQWLLTSPGSARSPALWAC